MNVEIKPKVEEVKKVLAPKQRYVAMIRHGDRADRLQDDRFEA